MNLRGVKYVVRRGDLFQLRIPVPIDLQPALKRKEIRWSLKTESRSMAAQRAFRAGLSFMELCDTLRKMPDVSEKQVKRMLQAFYKSLCDASDIKVYRSPAAKLYADNASEFAAENALAKLEEQKVARNYGPMVRRNADAIAQTLGMSFDDLPETRKQQLLEGIVRAYIEQHRYEVHRRSTLLDLYEPSDPLFSRLDEQLDQTVAETMQLMTQPPEFRP